MAEIWVTEFSQVAVRTGLPMQVGLMPEITTQEVTFTVSTQSAAFNANTRLIRVQADADAHLAFGANPTATLNSMPLVANVPEYFGVSPGDKVATYDGAS